jgi:hypothetical protein
MTHYLYSLSSWSLVAEEAVAEVRAEFGDDLEYDWRIAVTDYGGSGPHENYDWLVPDRVVSGARQHGAKNSDRDCVTG